MQTSANNETKSSAGDKYETGRAMAQLEIAKNSIQLTEALGLRQKLALLGEKKITETVQTGSLVMTSRGNFYLAIPAGSCEIDGTTYFAISADSPVGSKLIGLKSGDSFVIRDARYSVLAVQ